MAFNKGYTHEAITLTSPQTDRLFEIFMPSILIVVTRLMLGSGHGSGVGIWIIATMTCHRKMFHLVSLSM